MEILVRLNLSGRTVVRGNEKQHRVWPWAEVTATFHHCQQFIRNTRWLGMFTFPVEIFLTYPKSVTKLWNGSVKNFWDSSQWEYTIKKKKKNSPISFNEQQGSRSTPMKSVIFFLYFSGFLLIKWWQLCLDLSVTETFWEYNSQINIKWNPFFLFSTP